MEWQDFAAEISECEFSEIVNNSHEVVVVHFYAEWCMPCLMMSPIIEELAQNMKKVNFNKINIEDNKDLAKKFKISCIPCIIIFKKGCEVNRLTGVQTSDLIQEKIMELLNE